MRLFQVTEIWFGLLQFTQMFSTYANLNETLLDHFTQIFSIVAYPNLNKTVSITRIRLKPLELPKCSDCIQISMKLLYVTRLDLSCLKLSKNWIKLFAVTQLGLKLFHLAQIWMELLPVAESWFSVIEFAKLFQFMEIFLISQKLEWSCSNLLKFDWGCWNLPKCFYFDLNLLKSSCS